jgi:hypothetical protein
LYYVLVGLPQALTCRQCEISAATIQYLFHWNSILEQKLEELSQHNIAAVQDRSISAHDIGPLKAEAVQDSVRNLKVFSYCVFSRITGLNILLH